jgi:uncharacterized protein (TIGR00251 family)
MVPAVRRSARSVIHSTAHGIVIDVRVIPRARRSELAGVRGDRLLVRLNAPPVDGAANAELTGLLAAALDVPTRDVTIVAGERSREKRVRISGVDAATARAHLLHGAD